MLQTELSSDPSFSHMDIFQSKSSPIPFSSGNNNSTKKLNATKGSGLSVLKKKGPLRILTPVIKEEGTTSGEGSPASEEPINVEDFLDTLSSPEYACYGYTAKSSTSTATVDTAANSSASNSVLHSDIECQSGRKESSSYTVKSQVAQSSDPSPLRPGRLSFGGTPQNSITPSSSCPPTNTTFEIKDSSEIKDSPLSASSEIEDLKAYLLHQRELEAREREIIKKELASEKFRSRMIIGALGVGLGFTGLLLMKPEMQKTVNCSYFISCL